MANSVESDDFQFATSMDAYRELLQQVGRSEAKYYRVVNRNGEVVSPQGDTIPDYTYKVKQGVAEGWEDDAEKFQAMEKFKEFVREKLAKTDNGLLNHLGQELSQ
jgi:hypothetical protein